MRQILFQWGPFVLPAYGLFVGLACIVGMHLAEERAREMGLPRFLALDTLIVAFLGGLVGAKYLYFPFANDVVLPHSAAEEGRAFFGAMAGALVAGSAFLWFKHAPILRVLDVIFLYVPLGHSIGRIGCWFFGCCYGKVCSDSVFGVQFPRLIDYAGRTAGSPAFLRHLERGLISADSTLSLPVYPVQILAVLLSLMIFVCLRILSERKWVAGRTGSIVFLYCILYGVVRWCEELLRDQRVHWHLMTTAQFICVGMFIFGFVGLAVSLRRPALRNALVRQEPSLPNRRQRRREMLARRKTSWKGGDNTA